MTNRVLLKKSSVAAKVPLTTDLSFGEVALNYADGKLYYLNTSSAVVAFSSSYSAFSASTSVTAPLIIATAAITTSSTTGAFSYGTLGYSDIDHIATFQASINNYVQMEIQNTNAGAAASSDHIVTNNLSTATTYYGDFGMNSSGWVGSGAFNTANTVYLTATTGDLAIGTTTSNAIHFVVNGGTTDAATISSARVLTLANPLPLGSGGTGLNAVGTSGNVLTSNGTDWVSQVPVYGISANTPYTSTAFFIPYIGVIGQQIQASVTAQGVSLTINAPYGTAFDGQKLVIRITDSGAARNITWNAIYVQIGCYLPVVTVASKTSYIGCIYNASTTTWDVISVTTQF